MYLIKIKKNLIKDFLLISSCKWLPCCTAMAYGCSANTSPTSVKLQFFVTSYFISEESWINANSAFSLSITWKISTTHLYQMLIQIELFSLTHSLSGLKKTKEINRILICFIALVSYFYLLKTLFSSFYRTNLSDSLQNMTILFLYWIIPNTIFDLITGTI